jgi:hypothetical protein
VFNTACRFCHKVSYSRGISTQPFGSRNALNSGPWDHSMRCIDPSNRRYPRLITLAIEAFGSRLWGDILRPKSLEESTKARPVLKCRDPSFP